MKGSREGMALLEVLVALAILFAAGAAAVGGVQAALAAERRSALLEAEATDAERLLTALSLLTRADLDLRLGVRNVGEWEVEVLRPEPALYRIALSRKGRAPALVTLVHRPEAAR
ncbi:MAG TPA: hypothetical protein VFO06_00130 [Gemmatimonadales bacterium]|nr:hypothetical protein [Gemmatimonadales bacterium]